MEYYFTPKNNIDLENNKLTIENFQYNHLIKVLRKRKGDLLTLTDGERNIYRCEILKIDKDKITCNILEKEFNLYEPAINLSLYISPLRNFSRFEFAIEKSVELGVTSIHPVLTEYTVNKNLLSKSKYERLTKIIIGAMGQSQRCFLPKLYNTISFNEMLELTKEEKNKIVMYEFSEDSKEFIQNKNSNEIALFIGPEGGFSRDEISSLINAQWQVKSLGKRKLRAETAAIVSVYELIQKAMFNTS